MVLSAPPLIAGHCHPPRRVCVVGCAYADSSGDATAAKAQQTLVLDMLDRYQAQPNALFCADEVFCGRAPHRGTETCAVVEAMASLEQGFAVLGEPALYDRVETLAFNALPAALTADMW